MHPTLLEVCKSLDNLAAAVENGYSDDRTMTEIWGWSCPPLNRHDLANLARSLSAKIKENAIEELDDPLSAMLAEIPRRVNTYRAHSITYLFNGNGATAVTAYFSLINWVKATIEPLSAWQFLQKNNALPHQLARKLKSIQVELEEILPKKDELTKQIRLIQDATETAASLPVDLDSLKDARNRLAATFAEATKSSGKIESYEKASKAAREAIEKRKEEADKLVQQCEEAYKITTTKGLAGAFSEKAIKLSNAKWAWVGGLFLSLAAGVWIGASRFETLAKSLQGATPQWGVIWMDFALSVIGLAAPIWFAWVATKQIGQCFRLAEDYAFKASVAKAYEGYRREAARIDASFEARLFSSALMRLDEAPLRLVETDHHGSPWQELFSSPGFQKALDTIPELKDAFVKLAKQGFDLIKPNGNGKAGKEVKSEA